MAATLVPRSWPNEALDLPDKEHPTHPTEEDLIICLQGFGTTEENTQPMVIATYRLNWHRGKLSEKIS